MKNKFYETGVDFGTFCQSVPKSNTRFSAENMYSNEQGVGKIQWTDPVASRKLILELLEIVNTEAEYQMLLHDLAELDCILGLSSSMKGGAHAQCNMTEIITIKGEPVIAIYENFYGSYWFITEKRYKQDTILNGRIYRHDQIFFGYARLSACPEFAEFGTISEAELRLAGAWKVPKKNWAVCPEVEVAYVNDIETQEGRVKTPASDAQYFERRCVC